MTESKAPNQERRTQVVLQPMLQFKLAIYHFVLGTCFAATVVGVLHAEYVRLRSWLRLTEVKDIVDGTLANYATDALMYIGLASLVFLLCSVVITAITTHRMVGPTVAFRRHLQALAGGDYSVRTYLRPHDAFQDVADDLNALSRILETRASEAAGTPPPAAEEPAAAEETPAEGDAPDAEA